MNIIKEAKVTLISKPLFMEPQHLPVNWSSSDLGMEGSGEDAFPQLHTSDGSQLTEFAGRLCYMSQSNPANKTTKEYIENILKQAHGSVLEHANYTLLLEGISRACSHEIVRHRAGFAYSQLSQRYVDESDVDLVVPPAILAMGEARIALWAREMSDELYRYKMWSDALNEHYADIESKTERRKKAREAARSVLPNATETKIVMTGNIRSWRHFLQMRGSLGADAEIRNLAFKILGVLEEVCPEGFQDMRVSSAGMDTYIESEYLKV